MNVELILVSSDTQRDIAKHIIETYHSYVPTYKSVGRRIDYLVYHDGEIVGAVGIGSATYPPCKDVLRYMGVSKSEYKDIFNTIGNNWRFCLAKGIKNLGSTTLRLFRENAKRDWKQKYGDDLRWIVTFVGGGHDGAVYKADNWVAIGKTAGLPKHKSVSMKWDDNDSIAKKFVKPDGKDKKIIYIKRL
jgi:hypothetical protein